jgi:hypothetical protein
LGDILHVKKCSIGSKQFRGFRLRARNIASNTLARRARLIYLMPLS